MTDVVCIVCGAVIKADEWYSCTHRQDGTEYYECGNCVKSGKRWEDI